MPVLCHGIVSLVTRLAGWSLLAKRIVFFSPSMCHGGGEWFRVPSPDVICLFEGLLFTAAPQPTAVAVSLPAEHCCVAERYRHASRGQGEGVMRPLGGGPVRRDLRGEPCAVIGLSEGHYTPRLVIGHHGRLHSPASPTVDELKD